MAALVLFPARSPFVTKDGFLTNEARNALREVLTRTGGVEGVVFASNITVVPAGDVAATTVQAAIEELDTDKQPRDATLTAVAGVTTAADKFIYFTGVDAAAAGDITAFGRSLVDDASASAALTTLGVSTFVKTLLDDASAAVFLATLGVDNAVQTWLATPSSANLLAAVTDETGTGSMVFADSATLSNPTVGGNIFAAQGAPFGFSGSVTATLTQLRTRLLQYTGAGAANLTMPTGTDLDVVFAGALPINHGFDFTVRNKGGGTVTILTAADVTLDEAFTIAAGATGTFRVRKTAANTFTVYRVA